MISSFCPNANCVNVVIDSTCVTVWHTVDPSHIVVFTHDEWTAFTTGVKNGEFDAPGGKS